MRAPGKKLRPSPRSNVLPPSGTPGFRDHGNPGVAAAAGQRRQEGVLHGGQLVCRSQPIAHPVGPESPHIGLSLFGCAENADLLLCDRVQERGAAMVEEREGCGEAQEHHLSQPLGVVRTKDLDSLYAKTGVCMPCAEAAKVDDQDHLLHAQGRELPKGGLHLGDDVQQHARRRAHVGSPRDAGIDDNALPLVEAQGEAAVHHGVRSAGGTDEAVPW
mmetsp:Transcript_14732/g.44057  ORF Transcript_14732/g.44057 Transcript_14732/m.44057 type:complete len:217 (-) Transcript_14732:378-1028(-)